MRRCVRRICHARARARAQLCARADLYVRVNLIPLTPIRVGRVCGAETLIRARSYAASIAGTAKARRRVEQRDSSRRAMTRRSRLIPVKWKLRLYSLDSRMFHVARPAFVSFLACSDRFPLLASKSYLCGIVRTSRHPISVHIPLEHRSTDEYTEYGYTGKLRLSSGGITGPGGYRGTSNTSKVNVATPLTLFVPRYSQRRETAARLAITFHRRDASFNEEST